MHRFIFIAVSLWFAASYAVCPLFFLSVAESAAIAITLKGILGGIMLSAKFTPGVVFLRKKPVMVD